MLDVGEDCDGGAGGCSLCLCPAGATPDGKDPPGCSKCGNGQYDLGEQCDGGEGCNADCTCPEGCKPVVSTKGCGEYVAPYSARVCISCVIVARSSVRPRPRPRTLMAPLRPLLP